jgi:hypothetical protein
MSTLHLLQNFLVGEMFKLKARSESLVAMHVQLGDEELASGD